MTNAAISRNDDENKEVYSHAPFHFHSAGVSAGQATHNLSLVKPGQIFVISIGGGHGYTGLVELVRGGKLTTIEGNINTGGSCEGVGVFRRDSRRIADLNIGFVDSSSI